jgi:chromosome segregation ATPase
MAEQVKFRSAFRGFNRTDVVRHIDFLNNLHEVKLNQLHTEIEELRAELTLARQLPVRGIQLEAELEASKALCAELEEKLAATAAGIALPEQDDISDLCADLEAQLADMRQRLADAENRAKQAEDACAAVLQPIEEPEIILLPADAPADEEPHTEELDATLVASSQRIAELEALLTATQQRNDELEALLADTHQRNDQLQTALDAANAGAAQLEQALADAQTAAKAAAVIPQDLAAQELAAYRRAERVERMAVARARDIATQASGVLHDTTARVDEDAVELSNMFDQLTAQFEQLRSRMIASKSTLKDAVTAMHTIATAEDED